MTKKILLGCYEVPGYGGANTACHNLFQLMQADGLDVTYLNLIDDQDADYFKYVFGENFGNPKCLAGVCNCVLNGPLFHPHSELTDIINTLSPGLLIGVDYIAALLMKKAAPQLPLIFLTSGCEQAQYLISIKGTLLSCRNLSNDKEAHRSFSIVTKTRLLRLLISSSLTRIW